MDFLLNAVDSDIVVLRAGSNWRLDDAQRILVPLAGRGVHERLLARLLGSLIRTRERAVTFLRVVPADTGRLRLNAVERQLTLVARDLCPTEPQVLVEASDSPAEVIEHHAGAHDLLVLGVQRIGRNERLLGRFALDVVRRTSCPMVIIGSRG